MKRYRIEKIDYGYSPIEVSVIDVYETYETAFEAMRKLPLTVVGDTYYLLEYEVKNKRSLNHVTFMVNENAYDTIVPPTTKE